MILFLLALAFSTVHSYNIAIFAPHIANSQILFNKRVAEELAQAGHKVTVFIQDYIEHDPPSIKFDPRITVEHVNASYGLDGREIDEVKKYSAFLDLPVWDSKNMQATQIFTDAYKSCKIMLRNSTFLERIRAAKFDVAFTHMFSFCNIGIIHITKIPSWIWLNSGALMDDVASSIGVPVPPSYCPPLFMDAGDSLTLIERTKSFIGHFIVRKFFSIIADPETAVFRRIYGADFPDLKELGKKAPLVMVNSNALYDFARPTLAKVVNIGGIGIQQGNVKNLTGEYLLRANRARDGIIVMSFGSVAPMYLIPESWKDAFAYAFAQFPGVEFFVKHEFPEQIASILPSNVYATPWLPQNDLLHHPKALGLMTHGGYNSVQDAIYAGLPVVTTPLFGDQFRNAHLIVRLGMGLRMSKAEINRETVTENIRKLIEDKSLKSSAARIRSMVETDPVPAETLLVRWTEFLAQHKSLDNLVPGGADLPLAIYHSLDVVLLLVTVALGVVLLVLAGIRCALRRVARAFSTVDKAKKKQ